ncbi:MAG: hypothetical protein QE271_02980 [Bacteriovoracaceae bacterium]|nr:hypothetical protein [Bacteriovoracaceae bacterium]
MKELLPQRSLVKPLPLLILPCAGLGTRVGSPASKELLLSPLSSEPLIVYWLKLASSFDLPVHVISRKGKDVLHDFLMDWKIQHSLTLTLQILEGLEGEWPTTVLKSEEFWREKNILGLPDTVFSTLDDWKNFLAVLDLNPLTVMAHELEKGQDSSKWGVIKTIDKDNLAWCEKPLSFNSEKLVSAWGIFSFAKSIGQELFLALENSTQKHEWQKFSFSHIVLKLTSFKDLTRDTN